MFSQDNSDYLEQIIDLYRFKGEYGLIKPGFGTGSIADLPNLFKRNLGLKTASSVPELLKPATEDLDHEVFIFLDGFGHSTLDYALSNYRINAVRRYLENSDYTPITSVFPSTTSTATITYQTGLQPAEHGVIGYTSYVSELDAICNMISLSPIGKQNQCLLDSGWKLREIENSGTIYNSFRKEDVKPHLYIPNSIKNSGLTRITGIGAELTGYYSISHMLTSLRKNLEKSKARSFHFCYVSTIDTISHKIGPYTEDTAYEIEAIFQIILDQFIDKVHASGKVGVRISADHGHMKVERRNLSDAVLDKGLAPYLRKPVLGDFRAPVFRIKENLIGEAIEYLRSRYSESYLVFASKELMERGFFGSRLPRYPEVDRFGDIILTPRKATGIIDTSLGLLDNDMASPALIGMHGGLGEEEMIVPLISQNLHG